MIYQRFGKWRGVFSLLDLELVNFLTWVTEVAAIAPHFVPVTMEVNRLDLLENHYVVTHPPNDVPEDKADTSSLAPMPMTASVKTALCAYLLPMIGLLFYHMLDQAGVFGHHS